MFHKSLSKKDWHRPEREEGTVFKNKGVIYQANKFIVKTLKSD